MGVCTRRFRRNKELKGEATRIYTDKNGKIRARLAGATKTVESKDRYPHGCTVKWVEA